MLRGSISCHLGIAFIPMVDTDRLRGIDIIISREYGCKALSEI